MDGSTGVVQHSGLKGEASAEDSLYQEDVDGTMVGETVGGGYTRTHCRKLNEESIHI